MTLTREQYLKFVQHLSKFHDAQVCPVCRSNRWSIAGIQALKAWHIVPPAQIGLFHSHLDTQMERMQSVPVVLMYCMVCAYMRQFAWQPIERDMLPLPSPSAESLFP